MYQIIYKNNGRTYYLRACSISMGGIFTLDEIERKVYNTFDEASSDLKMSNNKRPNVFSGAYIERI